PPAAREVLVGTYEARPEERTRRAENVDPEEVVAPDRAAERLDLAVALERPVAVCEGGPAHDDARVLDVDPLLAAREDARVHDGDAVLELEPVARARELALVDDDVGAARDVDPASRVGRDGDAAELEARGVPDRERAPVVGVEAEPRPVGAGASDDE